MTSPGRLAIVALAALHATAAGDIITVDDDLADLPTADFTGIQAALNAAVDGDEIVVHPGAYSTPSNGLNMRGLEVTVRSVDPDDPAIVDSTRISPATRHAVIFDGTDSAAAVLDGFRFTGQVSRAFVVFENGAGGTLRRCVFQDFRGAGNNVALQVNGADGVVVDRCTFDDIRPSLTTNSQFVVTVASSANVVFSGCTWSRLKVRPLGLVRSSSVSFDECLFEDNTPESVVGSGGAGAIWISAASADSVAYDVTITRSRFVGNRSYRGFDGRASGGAIEARAYGANSSKLTIDRCEFFENKAIAGSVATDLNNTRGGAIDVDGGQLALTNTVFVGNESRAFPPGDSHGGAIHLYAVDATVVGCTIQDNLAFIFNNGSIDDAQGGGVSVENAVATNAHNNIIRGNRRARGGEVLNNQVAGFTPDSSNRRSGDPGYVRAPSAGDDGWGDIEGTPEDEGANDDYGDLRLARGSAARNAGNNARVSTALDLDGNDRIRGGRVDQGAHESEYAVYYVDRSVSPSGDGFSWDGAFETVGELPTELGEAQVRIARGTYIVPAGGIRLRDGARIRGGYPRGGASSPNPNQNTTRLSGDINGDDEPDGVNRADNASVILWAQNAEDVSIEGLTASGGNAPALAGGISLDEITSAFIDRVTIEDNDAPRAGGILIRGGDAIVTRSVVRENRSTGEDGGMRIDGGAVVAIDDIEISGNTASDAGGGVGLHNGSDTSITDSIIETNTANGGAGLLASAATVALDNTTVRGNHSSGGNAGLHLRDGAIASIVDSKILANTADGSGGGISAQGGATGTIDDTLIADNHADSGIGGVKVLGSGTHVELFNTRLLRNTADAAVSAIRFADSSSGVIDQSVVAGNTAPSGGAVRVRDSATLLLRQSTIAANQTQSSSSAGLLQSGSATMTVLNTIISGNTSNAPSPLEAQLRGSGLTLDYSLVEGWDGSFAGTGSTGGDPLFVDAPNGDYHIGENSPAIDAGDTNTVIDTQDLDGNPRVLDDTGVADTGIGGPPTIDLGAYEFQGTSSPLPCNTADIAPPLGTLDIDDVLAFLGAFAVGDPAADLAPPIGSFDIDDVLTFLGAFAAGCP